MSFEFGALLQGCIAMLSIGIAWGLLKGKVEKLGDKIETGHADALRVASEAGRSSLRSHTRLDDHSGRLTKIETGCIFHERRLDESIGFVRSEVSGLREALDKHVDAMGERLDALADKIDALRAGQRGVAP